MVGKIVESLNSINKFSKNIITIGSILASLLCIAGMIIVNYNYVKLQQVNLYTLGSTMIYTASVLFAQVIIGGLLIDYFGNLIHNHDD